MASAFTDRFASLAPSYSAARPTYPPALFAHLAGLAPARTHAWDCAAGSGQASLALAEWFARVTATDASSAQIAQAPPHPAITYRVAPAERSGLPDATVDLVTVAQALHWLEPAAFFKEARRVLVPAGVIAVWCYGLLRVEDEAVDAPLRHFYSRIVGPYWAPERALVETGYRDVAFPFAELAAPPFDMARDWLLAELLAYVRTWSATAAFIAARGHDPVAALAEALASVWGGTDRRRLVRWPLSLRLGRSDPGPG